METRQLKYFIDVANCLNFTKAAQKNHIAQTAMSQNIISLETQLGFKLFHRSNRYVSLTHLGKAFYAEALEIVNAVERAELRMHRIAAGSEGTIRIGFQGEHESQFLPDVIREFRLRYPNIMLELIQGIAGHLEKMLHDNEVDVIFNIIQFQTSLKGCQELLIESQPLCLFTPGYHPLAQQASVSRSVLSDEPMVFLNPSCEENIYHFMVHESLQSGFIPKIVGYATSIYSLLLMVECGIGITILPQSCCSRQDVACVPLEEESRINIVARWRTGNDNTAVPLFVELLKDSFQQDAS